MYCFFFPFSSTVYKGNWLYTWQMELFTWLHFFFRKPLNCYMLCLLWPRSPLLVCALLQGSLCFQSICVPPPTDLLYTFLISLKHYPYPYTIQAETEEPRMSRRRHQAQKVADIKIIQVYTLIKFHTGNKTTVFRQPEKSSSQ